MITKDQWIALGLGSNDEYGFYCTWHSSANWQIVVEKQYHAHPSRLLYLVSMYNPYFFNHTLALGTFTNEDEARHVAAILELQK